MKKSLAFLTTFLVTAGAANSQEAFRHLSVGLDMATTGIGLELALPLVSDHLVLAAGYNLGNVSTSNSTQANLGDMSGKVNLFIDKANSYLSSKPGETVRLNELPVSSRLDLNGKVRLGTFKAILEYYPSKKSNFHINAGIFVGSGRIINFDAALPDYWNSYSNTLSTVRSMEKKYPDFTSEVGRIPDLTTNLNGRTIRIKEPGNINVGLEIAKVRPYLGIGFGRSIPETHFGFQFDFGALYIGKPAITSSNETDGTSEISISNQDTQKILDLISKICVYPQLSFRLIYRIF